MMTNRKPIPDARIPSSKVPSFVSYLEERGIDGRAFLADFPGYREAIRKKEEFLPLSLWIDFNVRARDLLQDPDFGLNYGSHFRGMPTLLGYLLFSCNSAGEAMAKFLRYQRLEHHAWILEEKREGRRITLDFLPACPQAADRLIVDFVFASLLSVQERLTGHPLKPDSIRLSYPEPTSCAAHRAVFGCLPEFSQARSSMAFHSRELERPLMDSSSDVRARLEYHLERTLRLTENYGSFTERIVLALSRTEKLVETSVDSVAAGLNIGVRDLQLKLKAEGTTFKDILQTLLKQRSIELLSDGSLTIQEISQRLGYAEASAFHRAFARWTGKTPVQTRAETLPDQAG